MTKIEEIAFVLEHAKPRMAVYVMAPNRYFLVPFPIKSISWQYAFVNKDIGMYKVTFMSIDEIVDTLFTAKEICYGSYSEDAQPNLLYGKSLEQLKIEKDFNTKTNN